jgi:hypothetical protein
MKRLSELPAQDGLTARAHALIRATGPTLESEERLRRVRRSLDARAPAPRWMWRTALAFGLLAASAAAARSSVFSHVFGTRPALDERAASVPTSAIQRARATALATTPSPPPIPPAPSEPPMSSPPAALSPSQRLPTPRSAALSDVARVHEAAKALRHDADPERALQLLERGAPVSGPLAEEALALRIEASRARGDGRQAKLATAYLAQYPSGRYRELARQALSGKKP